MRHTPADFRRVDLWLLAHPWSSWWITVAIALGILTLSTALSALVGPR